MVSGAEAYQLDYSKPAAESKENLNAAPKQRPSRCSKASLKTLFLGDDTARAVDSI